MAELFLKEAPLKEGFYFLNIRRARSLRKGNGRSVICFVKLRPFPPQAPTQPKIRKVPAVKVKRILVAQRIKVYEMVGPPVTIS